MHDEQRLHRVGRWRAAALVAVVVLGLGSIVGSGGGGGCALAPGPCPGDFPNEPAEPTVTPPDAVIQVGGSVTFSADAPSFGNATYQWFRAPKGATATAIAGATAATYTLAGAQLIDDGSTFSVHVTGTFEGKPFLMASQPAALAVSSMPPVVFQDSEFAPADWVAGAVVQPPGGPTHVEQQVATGGNPGAYRQVALSMPGGNSLLTAFSTYQGGTYDPASQGPVYLIAFSEDCAALPGVLGVGPKLLLEQDGRRYAGGAAGMCDAAWRKQVFLRASFSRADFFQVDGPACAAGTACPDFSATGKPMTFGFVNLNQGSTGFAGGSGGFGVDNWVVKVWRR
ncbi:MAG TPA: hypothetical protein VLD35_19175 [Caldimonas sp.]|nr:hypothetical protein [Caldimonas sp.]